MKKGIYDLIFSPPSHPSYQEMKFTLFSDLYNIIYHYFIVELHRFWVSKGVQEKILNSEVRVSI
jgi:hypothetical protein